MKEKINKWLANYGDAIGFFLVVLGWTTLMFLLGSIWQLDQDLKEVKKLNVTTKIIEYRLGTTTIHKDTMDVVKYKIK